jgi:uncharacterized Zn finger protein
MSFYGWRPYVPVATRRAQAAKKAAKLAKAGRTLSPVAVEGRAIAKTFWGKAWCQHIESFSDYENRLPRGRTYARNGSILDLQITHGKISAMVMGSELYEISFTISPLQDARWKDIKARSIGQIDSLVELLQGRLSDAVMRVITDRDTGLFPSPKEITKTCSCPDSAGLCKHLAAVLYGIGARLDEKPELLFLLRRVDHLELLEGAPAGAVGPSTLDSEDLADVFGIEIAETVTPTKTPHVKKVRQDILEPQRHRDAEAAPAKTPKAKVRPMALAPSKTKSAKTPSPKKVVGKNIPTKERAAKPAPKPAARKQPDPLLAKALLKAKSRARRRRLLKKKKTS